MCFPGRILTHLRKHGRLVEPKHRTLGATKRRPSRPYAIRKPKEYPARRLGDLVQLVTLDIRRLPGIILKQFAAHDVVSRWDVLEAHSLATTSRAAQFLGTVQARIPFAIRAFQVDAGSKFFAGF